MSKKHRHQNGKLRAVGTAAANKASAEITKPETIKARDRWGTEYTLTRGSDGMFHGVCREAVDDNGRAMPFAVPETIAREWQHLATTGADMRAS